MKHVPVQHNPGSQEAIKHGCTCPEEDNHYGLGRPINDGANRSFWITLYCPLHSDFEEKKDEVSGD